MGKTKDNSVFVGITITPELRERAKELSVDLFGRVNLSGYLAYLLRREIDFKERSKSKS